MDQFISRERAQSDLLDCAAFLAERIKSADGHAEAMNSVLPRYLAKGDVDLAAELANAVDDPYSRDRLLIQVAERCAEIDDVDYAIQLADAIEEDGLRSQALERIALANANAGRVEKAAEIAESIPHPDFVYGGIAVYLASSGNKAAAEAAIADIEFPTARVNAYQQIAHAEIDSDKMADAANSLDAAFTFAGEIEHDEERLRAMCDIGNMYIHAERNDKAIETFAAARGFAEQLDNIHRDYFLVNCALGFLIAGSEDLSESTLDLVMDKSQMASALLGIARQEWKSGAKDDAIDTLDEAYQILKSQRDIETRDSKARNALMASIAVQFAGMGKAERAMEIAQENEDIGEQFGALTQIAQVLTLKGEDELARQALNCISEDANRLFALVGMSDAKKELNETDDAVALLDEAAELSETVPQVASRSATLNDIASRYAAFGLIDKAREAVIENLEVIAEIRDESSKAASLAGMSDVFEEFGLELTDEEREHLGTLVRKLDW